GLVEMLLIPGLGPKKVLMLYDSLKIDSIKELEKGAQDGRILKLKGFSDKTVKNILDGISFVRKHGDRVLYSEAYPEAKKLRDLLAKVKGVKDVEIAGSLRRHLETTKDIDLVAATDAPEELMEHFVGLPDVTQVTGHGETKSSVVLKSGLRADLRAV